MEGQYYRLSRKEIDTIEAEVNKSGITLPNLAEELTDHICCTIEGMVNVGYAFEQAMAVVRKEVGLNTLKDIEIQTLILINKKFRAMKKLMKISGIIGLSAVVISSIMKINHWPGASILLLLGFATFLLAYLPALSLTLRKEKIVNRNRQLSYAGVFTAFVLLLSFLFTFMHWPYADYFKVASWTLTMIFLIMLYVNIIKSEENRIINLSILLFFVILFIIDVTFGFLDINNPRLSRFTIEENFEVSINMLQTSTDKLYLQMDSVKDHSVADEMKELKTTTANVISTIEQLRDGLFASKAEQENFQKKLIRDYVITNDIEHQAWKIESEILPAYRVLLLGKPGMQPAWKAFVESTIQFSSLDFNNAPPVIYNNLQRLIRDIKMAENECLMEMQFSTLQ